MMNRILASKFGVALWAAMMIGSAGRLRADEGGALKAIPQRPGFDFSKWETVHVQEGGVEKSLYTYANENVRELTGKANFAGRGPMENFFSMAFEPELWGNEPVVKISYPDVKKVFGDRRRVSPLEFEAKIPELRPLAEKKKEVNQELMHGMQKIDMLLGPAQGLKIVPAVDLRGEKSDWLSVEELASKTKNKTPQEEKLIAAWSEARMAFVGGDAAKFNEASSRAVEALNSLDVPTFSPAWKFSLDAWNTKIGLFRLAGWVYLMAALVFLGSYLAGKKIFSILAGSALGLGCALHISALIIWGILAGRTPVSNLFESAVFIIGMMTFLSIVISTYYRTRLVGLAGSSLGAFFMGIANNIPLQYGRKILPLVDALQSYWLRIHVTSMLTSYAFFSLAFFTAGAWVLRRWYLVAAAPRMVTAGAGGPSGSVSMKVDPSEDQMLQYLDGLTFRIITIGFPILTGGVILGAVWASEAWGRPWGFDPKETAAAITWMIYAIYLHCRLFLGWRGSRGIWLSILGFGAVVFTYLGVSFFLPGLHSYVSEGVSFKDFLKGIIPGI